MTALFWCGFGARDLTLNPGTRSVFRDIKLTVRYGAQRARGYASTSFTHAHIHSASAISASDRQTPCRDSRTPEEHLLGDEG